MENHSKNIKIFTGNSHPELAREIAKALNIPLGKLKFLLSVMEKYQ